MSKEASFDGEFVDMAAATSAGPKKPERTTLPAPSDPMAVVRELVKDHQREGWLTLRRWRGGWMAWRETHWAEIEEIEVRSWLYSRLEHASFKFVPKPTRADPDPEPVDMPWQPNRHKVTDVVDALVSVTHLPEEVDTPSWLEPVNRDAPRFHATHTRVRDLVACQNGLLDVTTRELHPLTPALFNRVAVPFDYAPDAPKPERWLKFLAELWPDDPASIDALQEWFGYTLSGRTDLHKILLLIGPTRSGKGTIARVLEHLVGRGNYAGPTLASLGTNFGLAPLIGRSLAVVSDARLGKDNVSAVVERLLSVSGEDPLTIDIKFREAWCGALPTRFMVLSNELPRFGDASGAIANRFIGLVTETSFLGRENTSLTAELLTELSGILSWTLDGLDRLAKNNSFTRPSSSDEAIAALQDLVSPVAAFVRDSCITGPDKAITVSTLYRCWKTWADDNGHRPGSVQTFGRDLRAVVPGLKVFRPHGEERRYVGIGWRVESKDKADDTTTKARNGEPRRNPLQPQQEGIVCADCGTALAYGAEPGDICTDCLDGGAA